MKLHFTDIVNRDTRKAEMLLYGDLGDDGINGHYFAQELNWLGREYDEITIRINSDGGALSHGLSIVSEMMASPAYIIAKVDGVAASMAAVLLAAADKVVMNDYARIMIHSPYYIDDDGNAVKNLSSKDKKTLQSLKATLVSLLEKRGIENEKVLGMMRTDTWFDAAEALENKLIDEVITTGKKELAALEPLKLVAAVGKNVTHKQQFNMKEIIAKLNVLGATLTDDATNELIVAAIDQVVKPAAPEASPNQTLVDILMTAGEKSGAITAENKEAYAELAKTNVELFAKMFPVNSLVAKADPDKGNGKDGGKDNDLRISDLLAKLNAGGGTAEKKKLFDYSDEEINELREDKPEVYAKLYKEHYGVELKTIK